MRSKFPGYYAPDAAGFKKLWDEALIVMDANVLLDLYRISEAAKNSLLEAVEIFKGRVWIPYRVCIEYHRNMNDVIGARMKGYQDARSTLGAFKRFFEATRAHPFLDEEQQKEIESFCDKYDTVLCSGGEDMEKLITENPTKLRLADLLDGAVGDELSPEEMAKLFEEGKTRYEKKVPPGYMDAKDKDEVERYGDLIIWKEILKKAKADKVPILLVTQDAKEDWFLQHSGKTVGPRPELVHEFWRETSRTFYAYTLNRFLDYAAKHRGAQVPAAVTEELEKRILSGANDSGATASNQGAVVPSHKSESANQSSTSSPSVAANSGSTGPTQSGQR